MRFLTVELDHDKPYTLLLSGDGHKGVDQCDVPKYEQTFRNVLAGNRRLYAGMGDYCEYRKPDDKFYDTEATNQRIDEQLDWLFAQWEMVKKRMIGAVIGNHEQGLCLKSTINPIRRWCDNNGVFYMDDMVMITFRFPSGVIKTCVLTHGSGAAATKGAKVNKLNGFASKHDVDFVCMGHTHDLMSWVDVDLRYVPSKKGMKQVARYKTMGYTGSFYRTFIVDGTSYAQQKHYSPMPLGYLEAVIDPNKTIVDLIPVVME